MVYDVEAARAISAAVVPERPCGSVHAVDDEHVLALFAHPRLIRVADGAVINEWPELDSGTQLSSIVQRGLPPPVAVDRRTRRFAIAQPDGVHVVEC
ncbi:MAG TPA: hypothetical protein VF824_12940 [Thermoanaerobaculia bacterium]|jgi:hypothetical protein